MTNREYAVMNITKILDAAERLINSADFDGIIKYTNMACAPTVEVLNILSPVIRKKGSFKTMTWHYCLSFLANKTNLSQKHHTV